MSTYSASPPAFLVVDGPMRGASYAIPPGRTELGRHSSTGIMLDDTNVSRRHAALDSAGGRVALTDLESTNGTWVNGRRLYGTAELFDGDVVQIGAVSLRFAAVFADPPTTQLRAEPPGGRDGADRYAFGDVRGPVQTGNGQQYTAGRDQYLAGRDLFHDNSVRVDADYDPSDELFQGRGVGRALMALGMVIALVGFGLWMYFIFSGFGGGDRAGGAVGTRRLRRVRDRRGTRRDRQQHVEGGPQAGGAPAAAGAPAPLPGVGGVGVSDNYRFGTVSGPVQTGDGNQYTAGGNQYVAGGNQYVAGRDQAVSAGSSRAMLAELDAIRAALAELRLTAAERAAAERALTAMREELGRRGPNTAAASRHLQSFTTGLKEAGALASAGASLAESIGKIARWLGPLAAGVLGLL
jgi:hypothetical protein